MIDLPKQNASKAEYVHYKFCMKNTCNTALDLMNDFENTFNKDIISVKILVLEHGKGFIKVND